MGGPLKKPCDIYAFGMTLYEIFVHETPLSELIFSAFVELVVRQDVRPGRPDDEDAPQLSDAIWELAEDCWARVPKDRLTASAVCDIPCHLRDPAVIARPIAGPSLHLTAQVSPLCLSGLRPNLTLKGHFNGLWCAAFSPNGKYIVSGAQGRTIRVWDAQTGKLILGPLEEHTNSVTSVAFSPDSRRIASGSWDNKILVWHAMTGAVLARPFKGQYNLVCQFLPRWQQNYVRFL